ncbi:MAG TPA: hypothetical protein VG734_21120 [Lacunisphaera sp.]|nr:hypothetical protein [Lacunisphaera sp.]
MHFGLIAVKASVSEFRAAFPETWPGLQIAASADGFRNADEIWSWKDANERFVSAANWTKENPGSEVHVLCQDGPWAVLMDFNYVLAGDEKALQHLSARFGTALSFIVETSGGCAFFWCYESGRLRRMINGQDGEVTSSGERLAQEAELPADRYYMDETEQLMRAMGLSRPDELPVVPTAIALAVIDRTDHARAAAAAAHEKPDFRESPPPQERKPWWRFW